MKKILLAVLVLTSFTAKSQGLTDLVWRGQPFYFGNWEGVKSTYDTTVLYKGEATCHHLFVAKAKPFISSGCLVAHGILGCPEGWYDNYEICTICLKHIRVKETRTAETIKDAYEEALEKLKLRKQ